MLKNIILANTIVLIRIQQHNKIMLQKKMLLAMEVNSKIQEEVDKMPV